MTITFPQFISNLDSPAFLVTVILTLGVIFVNGWIDAPNAIATCISTRCLSAKTAVAVAAISNFAGVFVMSSVNATVAETIYNMVDFGGDRDQALISLCAAMVAIVTWAFAAWLFSIPTSESDSLIAGLTGAAIAVQGGISGINFAEWQKVIYGLVLSITLGFLVGWVTVNAINLICRSMDRRKTQKFFKGGQIGSAAAMAFMHGAQDGQKFMGVFLLGAFLAQGEANVTTFRIPIWLMLVCSALMALGTSIGGYRTIKSIGMKIVKLEKYQGFSADLAASACLFGFSVFGIPVSTTQTKSVAIMGVGAAKRISNVNWAHVKRMILTWALTFPGCGIIGFCMAKIFLQIV